MIPRLRNLRVAKGQDHPSASAYDGRQRGGDGANARIGGGISGNGSRRGDRCATTAGGNDRGPGVHGGLLAADRQQQDHGRALARAGGWHAHGRQPDGRERQDRRVRVPADSRSAAGRDLYRQAVGTAGSAVHDRVEDGGRDRVREPEARLSAADPLQAGGRRSARGAHRRDDERQGPGIDFPYTRVSCTP